MSDLTPLNDGVMMVGIGGQTMPKKEQSNSPLCRCKRCNHVWGSRKIVEQRVAPKRCPNCKSPYWNKEYQTKKVA